MIVNPVFLKLQETKIETKESALEIHREKVKTQKSLEDRQKALDNRMVEFKKEWLKEYLFLQKQFDYYVEEIQLQQDRRATLTRMLTGMPSGNVSKRMDERWTEIMEYTDEIIDYLMTVSQELTQRLEDMVSAVRELPEEEATILTARYLRGKSYREILKAYPKSERSIYVTLRTGIELLELPPDTELPQDIQELIDQQYTI